MCPPPDMFHQGVRSSSFIKSLGEKRSRGGGVRPEVQPCSRRVGNRIRLCAWPRNGMAGGCRSPRKVSLPAPPSIRTLLLVAAAAMAAPFAALAVGVGIGDAMAAEMDCEGPQVREEEARLTIYRRCVAARSCACVACVAAGNGRRQRHNHYRSGFVPPSHRERERERERERVIQLFQRSLRRRVV